MPYQRSDLLADLASAGLKVPSLVRPALLSSMAFRWSKTQQA